MSHFSTSAAELGEKLCIAKKDSRAARNRPWYIALLLCTCSAHSMVPGLAIAQENCSCMAALSPCRRASRDLLDRSPKLSIPRAFASSNTTLASSSRFVKSNRPVRLS